MSQNYQEKLKHIKRQNESLINTLITVSENSVKKATRPVSNSKRETVNEILYRVLKEYPYKFRQHELFYEVHVNQRKMDPSELRIERYLLQRSDLCKKYGWGFHGNELGKIALIEVDSDKYKELLNDQDINKKKAFNVK